MKRKRKCRSIPPLTAVRSIRELDANRERFCVYLKDSRTPVRCFVQRATAMKIARGFRKKKMKVRVVHYEPRKSIFGK